MDAHQAKQELIQLGPEYKQRHLDYVRRFHRDELQKLETDIENEKEFMYNEWEQKLSDCEQKEKDELQKLEER